MLIVKLVSYDEQFDTFECAFSNAHGEFESLLPASVIPYIAPHLCKSVDDLPYDLVGKFFILMR